MPMPPVLPPGFAFGYGSKAAEIFGNPLGRDASGRNAFERGTDILRGTVSGVVADVRNPLGANPNAPTGAIGDKAKETRGGLAKEIVVYGAAILLVVFGLLMLTRSGGRVSVYLKKQNTYSEGE